MKISVGTFNLNNLFSRFNFEAHVDEIPPDLRDVTVTLEFSERGDYRFRTFRGRLIQPMPEEQREVLSGRIKTMDLDVLAVQEAEDLEALHDFNNFNLGGLYPFVALIEGNDPRFIDVGVLSKLPLGAVTSWRHVPHPAAPAQPVFARDLLEVEILDHTRKRKLLTVFNNHLTSQFVALGQDPETASAAKAERRRMQCEMIARIVEARTRPASAFVILGDMNDAPDSDALHPLAKAPALGLVDGLGHAQETRPAKTESPPPFTTIWTHRFKQSGMPARHELFDQIWLSPSLADRQTGAFIDRRTRHSGDGSDHDPAWVELDL